eukprot:gene19060-22824_t
MTQDVSFFDEFVAMMETDAFWSIRKAVLAKLVPLAVAVGYSSDELIAHIIARTKDVKEEVRVLAFGTLAKSFRFNEFGRDQVIAIMANGLKDSSSSVRDATQEMLCTWLERMENNAYYRLLELLDVQENGELAELASLTVFERANIPAFSLRTIRDITIEEAFHFRVSVTHYSAKARSAVRTHDRIHYEECIEDIMPTLTEYRNVMMAHIKDEYITKQLLSTLSMVDMSDEVGRNNVSVFLVDCIMNLSSPSVLDETLRCLALVNTNERDFNVQVVELLSDMMDPLEEDPNIKKLAVLTRTLRKIGSKSPGESTKIQSAIDSLKVVLEEKDTQTMLKCSHVTHYLLLNAKKFSNSPEIHGLLNLVILPSIQSLLPQVRLLGVQNLGIFCLHRKDDAMDYITLFEKIIENDTHEIKVKCMRVVFDILHVFGSPKKIPKEMVPLYKMIRKYTILSTNMEIKVLCIEGFVKLLFSGVIQDNKILTFLFLELYSPSTRTLLEVRKCLYIFFQAYVADAFEHKKIMFDLTMPILRSITQASSNSPYSEINIIELTKFLLFLFDKPTRPRITDPSTPSSMATPPTLTAKTDIANFDPLDIHPKIAVSICQELISCFRGETKELTKILPLLKFDGTRHQPYILEIYELLDKLSMLYLDSNLERFQQSINHMLPSNYAPLTPMSQTNNTINSPFTEKSLFPSSSKIHTPSTRTKTATSATASAAVPTSSPSPHHLQLHKSTSSKEFNLSTITSFFEKQKRYLNTTEEMDKSPLLPPPPRVSKKQKTTTTSSSTTTTSTSTSSTKPTAISSANKPTSNDLQAKFRELNQPLQHIIDEIDTKNKQKSILKKRKDNNDQNHDDGASKKKVRFLNFNVAAST